MAHVFNAVYDGKAFLPDQPPGLEAGAQVILRYDHDHMDKIGHTVLQSADSFRSQMSELWTETFDAYLNDLR